MKYWIIKWNGRKYRQNYKRSSRIFETFVGSDLPFETYGYKTLEDVRLFGQVNEGDVVFCYQSDKKKYIAKCEVKEVEADAPGGLCLVLVKTCKLSGPPEPFGGKGQGTIHPIDEAEAKRIFEKFRPSP